MAMNIYAGEAVRRRDEILEIIGATAVHSQEELQALLKKRGVRVTQPTLSRDLRELGVAKSPAGYVVPGAMNAGSNVAAFTPRESREEQVNRLVRDSVLSVVAAMNLVVIKTPTAAAQPVASAIDAAAARRRPRHGRRRRHDLHRARHAARRGRARETFRAADPSGATPYSRIARPVFSPSPPSKGESPWNFV